MDPMTIGMLAGSGMNLLENYRKRAEQKDQAMANAMLAQISPWNSMAAQMMRNPEKSAGLSGIAQGTMLGGAQGQDVGRFMKEREMLNDPNISPYLKMNLVKKGG